MTNPIYRNTALFCSMYISIETNYINLLEAVEFEFTVLEISPLDLEVWCSETLPDAASNLGNLAGISV